MGRRREPAGRSRARTCARTSRPSQADRTAPACTSPRSASTRSTSTARRSATRCSRPAGRSTPSASRRQTYDVTNLVKQGDNAIGAILGDGWYSTRLQGGKKWGDSPALLAQLKITYADGTTSRITTDNSWQVGTGGLRASGIYDGETFDARLERAGWDQPGFNGGWRNAVERNETMAVEPSQAPPIKVIDTLQPKAVTHPGNTTVYDLGQNFAGWARITAHGAAGSTVKLRFGEILNGDGTLYTTNLRSAQQTDTFTLKGGGQETYEARFTYHGFRYVEVTGDATVDSLEGRVVTSDLPEFGTFSSSNALVNQIQTAIRWGQHSNFLAVPERRLPARRAPGLDR